MFFHFIFFLLFLPDLAPHRTAPHYTTQHTQPITLSYWLRKKHWVRFSFNHIVDFFYFRKFSMLSVTILSFYITALKRFLHVWWSFFSNCNFMFFWFFDFYFSASFSAFSSAERNADESVDRLLIEVCEGLLQNDRYVHINDKCTNKLICMISVIYYLSLEHTN